MALFVPRTGQVIALKYLVNFTTTTENLVYKLGATNITPADTDTAATYTEAAGGGYAAKTLTGASWTVTAATPSAASYAAQTWTFTGALTTNPTLFNYFIIRATSLDLVGAETYTSFTPANNGDTLQINAPQITATHT